MMLVPAGIKVHMAVGYTDLRKGLDGLAVLVEQVLEKDPFLCVGRDYVAEAPQRQLEQAAPGFLRHIICSASRAGAGFPCAATSEGHDARGLFFVSRGAQAPSLWGARRRDGSYC